jgi:hypothetical protein
MITFRRGRTQIVPSRNDWPAVIINIIVTGRKRIKLAGNSDPDGVGVGACRKFSENLLALSQNKERSDELNRIGQRDCFCNIKLAMIIATNGTRRSMVKIISPIILSEKNFSMSSGEPNLHHVQKAVAAIPSPPPIIARSEN